MELILERTDLREDCTVGTLSVIKRVDDEYLAGETKEFLYDTLEPRVKELDAKGRYTITTPTAIPEGRYAVVIKTAGCPCCCGCHDSRMCASVWARPSKTFLPAAS